MKDVNHTPPYDDALTGMVMFSRGRTFATDGGERMPARDGRAPARDRARPGRETMADVDHTPPDGDGARRVWYRGLPKPGVHVAGEP